MKALTLKDYEKAPYATWVEQGIKDIETRKWKPSWWVEGMHVDLLITCSKSSPTPNAGKAIVVVELFHIEKMKAEHEERAMCELYDGYSWFLRNRRTLNIKFEVKGELSIFNIELPPYVILTEAKPYYDIPLSF